MPFNIDFIIGSVNLLVCDVCLIWKLQRLSNISGQAQRTIGIRPKATWAIVAKAYNEISTHNGRGRLQRSSSS
jgi:PIN domain nuclease of toxin-antitoxin system